MIAAHFAYARPEACPPPCDAAVPFDWSLPQEQLAYIHLAHAMVRAIVSRVQTAVFQRQCEGLRMKIVYVGMYVCAVAVRWVLGWVLGLVSGRRSGCVRGNGQRARGAGRAEWCALVAAS